MAWVEMAAQKLNGIYLAIALQATVSICLFLRVRDFALNVLFATGLTTASMAIFLLLFNRDAFDLVAIMVVFGGSLLLGSPMLWLVLSGVSKLLLRRNN
jgi:hypothetical protein